LSVLQYTRMRVCIHSKISRKSTCERKSTCRDFATLKTRGFAALVTVLIITAVALIISSTIALKSLTHANISLSELKSAQAWSAANSCVENVLAKISLASTSWSSILGYTTSLDVGDNSCYIYGITATGTDYRLIRASSTVSDYVRKLQVIVATNTPSAVISSWREVGDF
jgi:hypothetical protein